MRKDAPEAADPEVLRLQELLLALREQQTPPASLETVLTHRDYFGLTTASPAQRAMCRIAEGRPLAGLERDPGVREMLACEVPPVMPAPKELAVIAAVRCAKSLLAAAIGVFCSQVTDVSRLGPGEVPRFSIVSISVDNASVIYEHLTGRVQASPVLRGLLLEEPTGESVMLRHPSGRAVELCVVAGRRAGGSLTSRWMTGCVFDEFPRMVGESDAVVNWDDSRKAVLARVLPGGIVAHIGSPWAPFGPAYDMVTEHLGKPSEDLVVAKAPGWVLNPVLWTPEECRRFREKWPDVYETDVAANFATQASAMFGNVALERARRSLPLEHAPSPYQEYTAAIDPATRGNGWTLVVATRIGNKRVVALAREWRGTAVEPLDPEEVLQEIAALLTPYRVKTLKTDQWAADPLRALARRYGLTLQAYGSTTEEQWERYKAFGVRLDAGDIELPPHAQLLADLRRVVKRVTNKGFAIVLPHTSDGRHCDFAPATMLALAQYLSDVTEPHPPEGSKAALDKEAAEMLKAATAKYGRKPRRR